MPATTSGQIISKASPTGASHQKSHARRHRPPACRSDTPTSEPDPHSHQRFRFAQNSPADRANTRRNRAIRPMNNRMPLRSHLRTCHPPGRFGTMARRATSPSTATVTMTQYTSEALKPPPGLRAWATRRGGAARRSVMVTSPHHPPRFVNVSRVQFEGAVIQGTHPALGWVQYSVIPDHPDNSGQRAPRPGFVIAVSGTSP